MEFIILVALVTDGGLESYLQLGLKPRENSGKRETGLRKLRIRSWNIGPLTGKFIELVKSINRRKINIACVEETRWVGSKARDVHDFKLWYSGGSRDRDGVGILVGADLRDAYASHVGLDEEVKRLFWEGLDKVVRGISSIEKIFIGGDFNDHIGTTSDVFDNVHGGFGFYGKEWRRGIPYGVC
ncbi:uncharacterized protein LOC129903513 [Solanum dulcamara]|uniref:uncharacterized protein LOC129903513 n=1 Tax=Solanum dulcamara TaxID=45834 RepID=UPI00248629F3|nr:uncharacterized protein LOC129903513 [Solanum dulcamara]